MGKFRTVDQVPLIKSGGYTRYVFHVLDGIKRKRKINRGHGCRFGNDPKARTSSVNDRHGQTGPIISLIIGFLAR